MRKLIESTLVSADGVVADPPLWAMEYRDEEVDADALERFSSSDAMLMGRVTYEFFAAIWPSMTGEFADRVNSIRKYVFSATLEKAGWDNSTIVRGDVTAEVTRLKQQEGGDIAIFGHGRLAQALLDSGLTDELRLSVHPVLAGHGGLLFRDGVKTPLRLVGAKPLGTGVVVLSYQPAGVSPARLQPPFIRSRTPPPSGNGRPGVSGTGFWAARARYARGCHGWTENFRGNGAAGLPASAQGLRSVYREQG